jgi:ABC-type Mn2+/Zn2+ transport system ATPase subunit
MFRALSLIIQLNYSQLASIPSCILIDDIGEGLDYERSSSLIKLLIEKAKTSAVQLVMSTNDRFVMNNVPLEYWCVMRRISNVSKVYNYRNAKKQFEDFELTGLSNFDFFTSGAFEEQNPTQ